jgi:hypothetical protein
MELVLELLSIFKAKQQLFYAEFENDDGHNAGLFGVFLICSGKP